MALLYDNNIHVIKENDFLKYVSRGGFKLEKALDVFKIDVNTSLLVFIKFTP